MHWQAEAIINYSTFSDNGFQGEMNAAVRSFLDLEALANDDLSTDGTSSVFDTMGFLALLVCTMTRCFFVPENSPVAV